MDVGELVAAAERLLGRRHGRLAAGELRAALCDLYEFWLSKAAAAAGVGDPGMPGGVALVAVGGLGRRELVPYSDLDLVLLHDGTTPRPVLDRMANALWYPLWDAKVGLDHAVRTGDEALSVARSDLRTAMGLLEVRAIAGDEELAARLATAARQQWRRTARKRLPELADAVRQRWRRSGHLAQSAEPDLKHAGGGLRDIAVLEALAAAQLIDRLDDELRQVKRLLLDIRTELRLELRRNRDVLSAEQADKIAADMGFGDRFALLKQLYSGARAVRYALEVALRSATGGTRRLRRRPLAEGVVLHGDEVALARGANPAKDPALLLRVAAAAAHTGRPVAHGTLRTLADSAPELRQPWPADARSELIALLGAGEGLIGVIEALDTLGLWSRLLPEWGAVRDLPPAEPVHRWCVDRHLVQTCVEAAKLTTSVARPDLLLIGALLHDIGKGRGADHSVIGADIARQVTQRLGLPDEDVAVVTGMVRHHLLLPHVATRRDITERETVRRVVDTIDGNALLLELLHALTQADSLATGPGMWTPWKAKLVAELVARCRQLIRGVEPVAPDPLTAEQQELAARCRASGRPEVLVTSDGAVATITVAARRDVALLAPVAGALALSSLEVAAATQHEDRDVAVAVLHAAPRFGSPPDDALLREKVVRAVTGRLALAEQLAAKERDYDPGDGGRVEPTVLWFDDEAEGADVALLELRATNRIGLLHRVATALGRSRATVKWARVATFGSSCVDAFAVRAVTGDPRDEAWRRAVERAVLAAAR
ncbi:[protein-PII] uridylyltransferase [Thermocrispum sp.]|nr:[protein-PII] uridylyltransferase [Thermocrispum sp.]